MRRLARYDRRFSRTSRCPRRRLDAASLLLALAALAATARLPAQQAADSAAAGPSPLESALGEAVVEESPAPSTVPPSDTLPAAGSRNGEATAPAGAPAAAPAAGDADSSAPSSDSATGDALYEKLVAEGKPGQIVYQGSRLTLYPSDKIILLSGQARAAQDSSVLTAERISYLREENIVQAFGGASVERGSDRLQADTLFYDQGSGDVSTFGVSTLSEAGREVVGENLRYSMDRQSGILTAGRTEYDRWFLTGEDMNKIGERTFVVTKGTFTTDPAEVPDYHFASKHIKLKQEDVLIARPIVLYVSDVPIFYLPWYLEPLGQDRRSGILRPKIGLNTLINASGSERNVQDLGYYLAISDYMDAQAALDWFAQSRTVLRFDYRYAIRYLLNGSAHYEQVWNRNRGSKDTLLRLGHDHTFDPSTQLRVDANIATSRQFFERNSFDADRILQRALRSNAAFTRRFTWGNLTAGAFSDFRLQEERTDFKIPQVNLSLNTRPLFPGSRLDGGWRQNLQVGAATSFDWDYAVQGDTLSDRDSTLVNQQTSVTRATLSGPFELLGFVKTTPSVDFTETLFNNRALPDSVAGALPEEFGHLETVGASLSLAANVFRIFQGGPRPVTKMRHTFSPAVSFRYQPGTTPREELPFGFPGGGGVRVLNASVNLTNNIDLKVRETQAQAQRRSDEEDRLRRARQAGLLKARGELTLEERTRLDSIAVADSLARLESEAVEDSLERREDAREDAVEEAASPADSAEGEAAAADSGDGEGVAHDEGAADDEGAAEGEGAADGEATVADSLAAESEGEAGPEEKHTERTVRLLTLTNRFGYDFERAAQPLLLGVTSLSTTATSQVSSAVSVSLSANHDLTDTKESGREFFEPFLQSLNTVVRFGGGRDFPNVRTHQGEQAVEGVRNRQVTDAEAGQGGLTDGVGLGDAPPGFEAIQSSSLGRWSVDLTHSLTRARQAEGRQSLRFGTSFSPTRNWALRYSSGYNITDGLFQDQTFSLVRDLNRWQATLNLNVFPQEPQDRVLVEFAVYLRDIPDLRIPYRTRRE